MIIDQLEAWKPGGWCYDAVDRDWHHADGTVVRSYREPGVVNGFSGLEVAAIWVRRYRTYPGGELVPIPANTTDVRAT